MACCPPHSHGYLASTRDHKGTKITAVGGTELYSTGSLSESGRAILLVPDIWGWDSGRVRNIADHLAQAGYLVVVPKILQPTCVVVLAPIIALCPRYYRYNGGTDGDALSPDVAPWIPETGGWPVIAQWLKENMVRLCDVCPSNKLLTGRVLSDVEQHSTQDFISSSGKLLISIICCVLPPAASTLALFQSNP